MRLHCLMLSGSNLFMVYIEGAKIYSPLTHLEIGTVTSGLPSPSVGENISMGYIATSEGLHKKGSEVLVEVRKKMRRAVVGGLPWIVPGYHRG